MHRIRMRALTGMSMRLDKPSYNAGICGMRDCESPSTSDRSGFAICMLLDEKVVHYFYVSFEPHCILKKMTAADSMSVVTF